MNYKIIKIKIVQKGYTNKEIAKITGMNEQTLSNWINGKNIKQINQFIKLCKFLNIKIEEL